MMRATIHRRAWLELATFLLVACGILLAAAPANAQTYPAPWIADTAICPVGGPYTDCWVPIPRFSLAGIDQIAAADDSHNSNPQPRAADIFDGELADQTSIWFAYDSTNDVIMFRKRLDGTPTLAVGGGSNPPGTDPAGPFASNTAWNFILDFNGDGWGDIVAATDGNSGTLQDPGDTIQLGWADTPGNQEVLIFGNGGKFDPAKDFCSNAPPNQGRILFYRKANEVPPIEGCPTQLSTVCDFHYTRVLNDCPTNTPLGCDTDDTNFDLAMQFPRSAFDDCLGPNDDGDTVGGSQKLKLDTHFMLCVTTSTQPNDFTKKDLSLNGSFNMRKTRQLVCSDPCTLTEGCSEDPVILDLKTACGTGTNKSPITLTALVMDTLIAPTPDTVTDSIQDVAFDYTPAGGTTYVPAVSLSGAANPVTSPDTLPNTWTFDWDTSALTPGLYIVRVRVTDDQGNQTDGYYLVDTNDPNCGSTPTPVTLADFTASNAGGQTRFKWTTATETGTVGFNLYAINGGVRHRLNRQLIPSRAIDTLVPQTYTFDVPLVRADSFELEDVDLDGAARRHGRFRSGVAYGRPVETDAVNWSAVRTEHSAKAAARAARRAARVVPGASAKGGVATAAGMVATRSFPTVDLAVDTDGVYRVTYEELAAAGFDLDGMPVNRLAVAANGQAVARRVVSETAAANEFGPGSYIEFVGAAARSLYTHTRVYRLVDDASLTKKMQEDQRKPSQGTAPGYYMATALVEKQLAYTQSTPSDDPWYETYVLAYTSPKEKSFTIDVGDLVDGAAAAQLDVDLWGMTVWPEAPDHHVVVELNGQRVADDRFDGRSDHRVRATLPAGALHEGANTLTVRLPGDTGVPWDLAYINRYSISYPRAPLAPSGWLDLTLAGSVLEVGALPGGAVGVFRIDGDNVTHLANVDVTRDGDGYQARFAGERSAARYLVVTQQRLLTPAISAPPVPVDLLGGKVDYLVIAHPDFLDGVQPLVDLHESEGMSVKVVDVTDVYNVYSGGTVDPEAIRAYIGDAARVMGVRFVLLVGGDTYDYFNYLGSGSVSFIPTLYARTGDLVSFAPVDPLFGDVDGDGVQDIAVGRLPVRTDEELANVVDKTLEYTDKHYSKTAVFAADANDPKAPVAFTTSSEAFIAKLGAGWDATRAYVEGMGVSTARARLIDAIDQGTALTDFIGHSGLTVWTFAGLFNSRDVATLTNEGRPTVVAQWGCWNTYHVEPAYDGLGQRFLLEPDRGAAAVLGSATWTLAESDDALGRLVTPLLTQPGTPIGTAVVEAKQELARRRPDLIDVQLGWTLLGDPALVVDP